MFTQRWRARPGSTLQLFLGPMTPAIYVLIQSSLRIGKPQSCHELPSLKMQGLISCMSTTVKMELSVGLETIISNTSTSISSIHTQVHLSSITHTTFGQHHHTCMLILPLPFFVHLNMRPIRARISVDLGSNSK